MPAGGDDWDDQTVNTAVSRVAAVPPGTETAAAMLVVLSGPAIGRSFPLGDQPVVMGRTEEAEVALFDAGVSRRHAEVRRDGEGWVAADLGSLNGTAVDGKIIAAPTRLQDGARIQLGARSVVKFRLMDSLEAEAQRRLSDAVYRDGLTGAFNRRYMELRLNEEFGFAERHGRPLSLLLVDVDFFKRINDTHGHQAGDEALRALGRCLLEKVRREDVVARYGGEEFLIIARGIDVTQAIAFGERVRAFVRALRVPLPGGGGEIGLTVSVGCACYRVTPGEAPPDDAETVLKRADEALYEAKQAGRDRVCGRP
ncbi:MAG TPA: GGDEF domain-containing protein [Myxococcota bacterium]|jgi:diguanylate cyclase (GGDEF)-like protein|nr:GGDEF domain-containing protein [Myxococcota bacterium]